MLQKDAEGVCESLQVAIVIVLRHMPARAFSSMTFLFDCSHVAGHLSARASEESREKGKASEGSSSSCGNCAAGGELALREPSFKPLRIMPSWAEPAAAAKRLTAIPLPSGMGAGGFSIRIADDGEHLELRVAWPKPLAESRALHRKWLPKEGEELHVEKGSSLKLKFLGFEKSLKRLRERNEQAASSAAQISLPLPVQPHITQKRNTSWSHSPALTARVDLKAFAEDQALASDAELLQARQMICCSELPHRSANCHSLDQNFVVSLKSISPAPPRDKRPRMTF